MFPLAPSQKVALADLQKRGIENRIAWIIVSEGCLTFEDFCARHTTREMLRIPNFGKTALRKVMTFAVRENIEIRDDRLPVTPRPAAPVQRKGPTFEYKLEPASRDIPLADAVVRLNTLGAQGWEMRGVLVNPRLRERGFLLMRKNP
jgi:hypothetical protein